MVSGLIVGSGMKETDRKDFRYVAFLDILGWASLVTADFEFACSVSFPSS